MNLWQYYKNTEHLYLGECPYNDPEYLKRMNIDPKGRWLMELDISDYVINHSKLYRYYYRINKILRTYISRLRFRIRRVLRLKNIGEGLFTGQPFIEDIMDSDGNMVPADVYFKNLKKRIEVNGGTFNWTRVYPNER